MQAQRTDPWLRVVLYRPERQHDPPALDHLGTSTTVAIGMLNARPGFRIGYWGHDPIEATMGGQLLGQPQAITGRRPRPRTATRRPGRTRHRD